MSGEPTPQLDSATPEYNVLWGPIPRDVGVAAGALDGCQSILVGPPDSHQPWVRGLMERVRALIPDVLLPSPNDDDVNALVQRLAASDFLDDIHVLKGGKVDIPHASESCVVGTCEMS